MGLMGFGLVTAFSDAVVVVEGEGLGGDVAAEVQIVAAVDATAAEEEIEGWDLGSCWEWARKAARKLLRKGLCVGILSSVCW